MTLSVLDELAVPLTRGLATCADDLLDHHLDPGGDLLDARAATAACRF